jgi:queuosine precursor transporter
MIYVVMYIVSIVIANVVTAKFAPVPIGIFLVPTGTFLIGLTLFFRNFVQTQYGRHKTYIAIVVALLASAVSSQLLGDTFAITIASAVSFLFSEAADTETFTRIRASFAARVFFGGTVGAILDSTIFVILGLSPIGAGFVTWHDIPLAIFGQLLVKVVMQAVGAIAVRKVRVEGNSLS